jgi:hypothetical protein
MEEVLEIEHAGWKALCDGSGGEFYGSLMTDEAKMILANGSVMDRGQVVDALSGAAPWDSYSIDDPSTSRLGDDAVAVAYTGTGVRGEQRFVGMMTSVYVRSGQDWKLAVYQQTPKA